MGDRGAVGLGKDVNIIMVMNEAFSDITDGSMFNWAEGDDPLPNLHALQNDPHALTGHIVVPALPAARPIRSSTY